MPCVRHLPRCTDCSPRPYEEVHRALARRAAEEGIILLKNENHTLPLPSGCRIALYGTGALHTLKGGTGSGDVNARETVSIRDGLYAAGFQIANEAWQAVSSLCLKHSSSTTAKADLFLTIWRSS